MSSIWRNFFGDERKTSVITLPPPRFEGDETAAYCTQCGGEIYRREDYFRIDGRAVCTDCLAGFAEDYFRFCKIAGGTNEKA